MAPKARPTNHPNLAVARARLTLLDAQLLQYDHDVARLKALRDRTAKVRDALNAITPSTDKKTPNAKPPSET